MKMIQIILPLLMLSACSKGKNPGNGETPKLNFTDAVTVNEGTGGTATIEVTLTLDHAY
jgi:hypothetical protein